MSSTVFVNSVTLSQAAWFQDVDNVAYQFLTGVAGTNTITATGPAGLGAYAAGLKFRFIPAATNTGATTINITGTAALGARNIFSGGAALLGGELIVGIPSEIVDDGTRFHILGQSPTVFTSAETAIGGASTNTTVAHGLAAVPRFIQVALRNKTAELGFSIGDEVVMPGSATALNLTVYSDATVIGVINQAGGIAVARKDTQVSTAITNASWKFVFRAWR